MVKMFWLAEVNVVSNDSYQYVADKFIFKVGKSLLYTEDDLWIEMRNNRFQIGVTDFLQRRGGDVVFVELPQTGSKIGKGEELAQLETIKTVISVKSPMDGTVTEANSKLADRPEKINEDPYGEGWLVTLSEGKERPKKLLTAEQYLEQMKLKIQDDMERSKKEAARTV